MFKFWFDMSMLGLEAQQVIWLRSMKIAMGGKAGEREVRRMVSEKATAAVDDGGEIAACNTKNRVCD
jgi:hypothetical protein